MAEQELPVYTEAISRETLTVAGTAVGFTAAAYKNVDKGNLLRIDARIAFITADGTAGTNDVRWTCDSTAPVGATTGHLLKAGQVLIIKGFGNITKFRTIRDGGTSGSLQVTFFG